MDLRSPYHDESMWKGAKPETFAKARRLRKEMTETEKILWQELSNKKLLGFKFRRQHPLGYYILDFYCHAAKLAIEIDGGYHLQEEQKSKDKDRTSFLNENDIEVIRFTNEEVLKELPEVMKTIRGNLTSKLPPTP